MKRLFSNSLPHCACILLFVFAATAASGCKSPTLTVMTINIRYDNPGDGWNAWPKRRAFMADIVRKHDPDLLGLQEVLVTQRDQLLVDLPAYDSIGVGRDDGDRKGEYSPVFFRRSRFTVLDKGWFWLSETPDKPGSMGWDAACSRIATWVRLRDETTHRELLMLNTHFDHKGSTARTESAARIARFLGQQADQTMIVTGDFNCGPDSKAHSHLVGSIPALRDAFTLVVGDETDAGTFNGFEGVRTGPRIDWILHTHDLVPLACEIIRDSRSGRFPSDHFPVAARFRITLRG